MFSVALATGLIRIGKMAGKGDESLMGKLFRAYLLIAAMAGDTVQGMKGLLAMTFALVTCSTTTNLSRYRQCGDCQ